MVNIADIIDIVGILGGVIVALIAFRQYYRGNQPSTKIISVYNLLIFLFMIIVGITTLLPQAPSLSFLEAVKVVGILLIGCFVIYQAFYLFGRRRFTNKQETGMGENSVQQDNHPGSTFLPSLSPQIRNEEIESELLIGIRNSIDLKYLQILDMSYPLETTQMYVHSRVYEQSPSLPDNNRFSEDLFVDPLDILDEKERLLERQADLAQNPIEIINRESWRLCVLLGEPGIGKTTFLKHLTLALASNNLPDKALHGVLPIFIPLKKYAAGFTQDLLEFIKTHMAIYLSSSYSKDSLTKFFTEKFSSGMAILLLDGLDETYTGGDSEDAQETHRQICHAIASFARKYEKVRIIITSRKAIYEQKSAAFLSPASINEADPTINEFRQLGIVGFLPDDVRLFIKRWFEERPSQRKDLLPEDLTFKILSDTRLRDLSRSPLMLAIITWLYWQGLDVASRRPELYQGCVTKLLEKWDPSRSILRYRYFLEREKEEFLQELAWYFSKEMVDALDLASITEIEAIKDVFLENQAEQAIVNAQVEQILQELITNTGLLVKKEETSFAFSHLIFQEYFAARYAMKHEDEAVTEIQRHRGNSWWEEITILYAAYTGQLENIFRKKLTEDVDIYYTNLLLAARCIVVTPLRDWTSRVKDKLVEALKQECHLATANELAKSLVEIADREVQQELLNLFIDNKGKRILRLSIAGTFSTWASKILEDEERRVLCNGLLGQLQEFYSSPAEVERNKYVVYALGILGDANVAASLLKYLKGNDEASPQMAGLHKLSNIQPAISEVRIRIIKALARLHEPSTIRDLSGILSSYILQPMDNKEVKSEKIELARMLGTMGRFAQQEEDKKLLANTLFDVIQNHHKDDGVRFACIEALGIWRNTDDSITKRLENLSRDESFGWSLRGRAKIVLGLLGDQDTQAELPSLFKASEEGHKPALLSDREELVEFLLEQNASALASDLVGLVFDPKVEKSLRMDLAESLGTLGDELVAQTFWEHMQRVKDETDSDPHVESKIILALADLYDAGKLKTKVSMDKFVKTFLELLTKNNTGHEMALSCAMLIERFGYRTYREQALQELKRRQDIIPSLRDNIYILQGRLGEHSVLNELVDLLFKSNLAYEDSSPGEKELKDKKIRERVVAALQTLNDPSITNRLVDHLFETPPEKIRKAILRVLGTVANEAEVGKRLLGNKEISSIDDDIYETVRQISGRNGLRVFKQEGEGFEIKHWSTELVTSN